MLRLRGWGGGVLAAMIPCLILTAFYLSWAWIFTTVFYTMLLAALMGTLAWHGKKVEVQQRVVRTDVFEGDALEVEVDVKLRRAGLVWFGLRSGDHQRLLLPGQGRNVNYLYTTQKMSMKRGSFHLPPIEIEGSDVLGWFRVNRLFHDPKPFWVYPRPEFPHVYKESWMNKDRLLSSLPPAWQLNREGELRQFRLGDSYRYIDWKASARSEHLYVRENSNGNQTTRWIVIPDGGWNQHTNIQLQERAARIAAAVITENQHEPLGLLTVQEKHVRLVLPDAGTIQERMRQLAEWDANSDPQLAHVLAHWTRNRLEQHRLLIVTPQLSPACSSVLESCSPGMIWQFSAEPHDLYRLQRKGWVIVGPDHKVVESHAN